MFVFFFIFCCCFVNDCFYFKIISVYDEKGLEYFFDKIIEWIKSDCSLLLDLTHKSVRGFDFLTNSVFFGIYEQMVCFYKILLYGEKWIIKRSLAD